MSKKTIIWAASILVLVTGLYIFVSIYKNTSRSSSENESASSPSTVASASSQPTEISVSSEEPTSEPSLQVQPTAPGKTQATQTASASPSVTKSPEANNSPDVPEGTSPGNKAINFTLTDLDGNKVSLSDFRGKNVYLNFFATWCPPCKKEMPDIEKYYNEYKDRDFEVIVVDLGESKSTVESFISKNKYTFRVLLDSNQSVAEKYGISSIPVSYFISKDGIIVSSRVGALDKNTMKRYIDELYK
jgi:peroxiredoxin